MPNWSELAVFVGAVSGSIATLIFATQKSRCSEIKTPCVSCKRPIPNTGECYDLENQLANISPELQPEQVINKPKNEEHFTTSRPPDSIGVSIRPDI